MEYYTTNKVIAIKGMSTLKGIFPDAEADSMNFVIFSTSGVHGTYSTIEDIEERGDEHKELTFLVIKPRIVQVLYGNCLPENQEDFKFLKKLRATSREIMGTI